MCSTSRDQKGVSDSLDLKLQAASNSAAAAAPVTLGSAFDLLSTAKSPHCARSPSPCETIEEAS